MKQRYITQFRVRSYIGLTLTYSYASLCCFSSRYQRGWAYSSKRNTGATVLFLGFQNIYTFKQSGNIIFETIEKDTKTLISEIQIKLKTVLGYEVAVFLRTVDQLRNILDEKPFKNQKKESSSFLVTFVNEAVKFPIVLPVVIPKSTAEIIKAQEFEIYSVTHGGGEGALPNSFIEKTLKMKATTRNVNVIEAIVEKFG